MQGHAFVTDDVTEETYAGALMPLMADFVGTDEAAAVGGRAARAGRARRVLLRLHPILLHWFTLRRPAADASG